MPQQAAPFGGWRDQGIAEDGKVTLVTADQTLDESESVVDVEIPDTGTRTVTLPPVPQMRGKRMFFHFHRTAGYSNGTVTVQDSDEGAPAYEQTGFANDDDLLVLESTGWAYIATASIVAGS